MRVDVHPDLKQNAKMASVSVTDLPYIEKNMDSLSIMNSLQYVRLSMYFLIIKSYFEYALVFQWTEICGYLNCNCLLDAENYDTWTTGEIKLLY